MTADDQPTGSDLPPIQFLATRDAEWLREARAILMTREQDADPEIRRIALWRRLAVEAALKEQSA